MSKSRRKFGDELKIKAVKLAPALLDKGRQQGHPRVFFHYRQGSTGLQGGRHRFAGTFAATASAKRIFCPSGKTSIHG